MRVTKTIPITTVHVTVVFDKRPGGKDGVQRVRIG